MRVLAGGPARETTSPMFELHREGLIAQVGTGLTSSKRDRATDLDGIWDITIRHEIVPDDAGPRWHAEKIERVAKVRQGFLKQARFGGLTIQEWSDGTTMTGPDALLLVDTDVILGPGVLERMWAVDADVVYGVFWTEADWGQPVGEVAPNVWRAHPYNFDRETWDALTAPGVNEVEVYGGGACTLIRGRGFESRYWPLLESIRWNVGMWQGEDRSFNLGLETRGIRQVAVTNLPIVHLHHEHQRTPEAVERARQEVGL